MKKINIAELLKDCPKGMELDCKICNGVKFIEVVRNPYFPIVVRANNGYEFTLTKYGQAHNIDDAKCVIFPKGKTTWEGFVPPCKFKDGDILVHTQNQRFVTSIYHNIVSESIIGTHCILWDKNEGLTVNVQICYYPDDTRFATEEEKQKLFDAIKANGYKWNAETKTLEKVPNKFDITTLKPFDKVLVRVCDTAKWFGDFYLWYDDTEKDFPYNCVGGTWSDCIPYESNEHLLGTTDNCDEYYKIWE